MALTSASFMAEGGYTSSLATKLDKVDCSAVLSAVLKADRELLGHIKMGPPAENIETNWIEDELYGVVSAAQLLNQFRQCDSHPVDFWRPGFSDHGNSHMPLHGFDVFNRDGGVMCKFHAFMVADEFNNFMT